MQTVCITGSRKVLGFATAKYFINKGLKVIISGRIEQRLIAAKENPFEIAESIYFLSQGINIIGEILVSDGGRRLQ